MALAAIPLSSAPRAPRIVPQFRSLALPAYLGDFRTLTTRIVGLHARDTYDLAKDVAEEGLVLEVARDVDNEHDDNACLCQLRVNGTPELVGYVDAEDSSELAEAIDAGAVLRARPTGQPPWSGRESKGGSLDVEVYLEEA